MNRYANSITRLAETGQAFRVNTESWSSSPKIIATIKAEIRDAAKQAGVRVKIDETRGYFLTVTAA